MSLLVLDDTEIRNMLKDPAIVTEFPFMKAAASHVQKPAKSSCKPCAAKAKNNTYDYAGIRAAIAGMPPERKLKLKQLLGVDSVRLRYVNARRSIVKLTF